KTLELTDVWTGEVSKPVNDTVGATLPAHACVVYRAKVVDR
ncbi:MAG TPA: alpha-galactosidase, partial [Ruminococcaceae bacterium]|nr:alpha-galactosidase [Oscillospiraceae bacterium]